MNRDWKGVCIRLSIIRIRGGFLCSRFCFHFRDLSLYFILDIHFEMGRVGNLCLSMAFACEFEMECMAKDWTGQTF